MGHVIGHVNAWMSKVLRAACLPCQHCQSYSVRGSRVLHACGKAYSLLSCYSGSAQLSCWPFTGTGQHCGCRQVQHYWQQCRCVAPTPCDTGQSSTGPGGGVTPSLARLDKTGMCCCCKPCVVRGLRRGDTFKAYGTTKMWEIMVSMELNDR